MSAFAAPAFAAADFYGVQMKSEDFAQNVFLINNNKIPDFSNDRPGIDKRIYAYGYMSSVVGGGHGLSIEVFNHSDKTIETKKLFRELVIVAYDGRRYDRSETEMMWSRDQLKPGEEATFNFKFPGIRVGLDEIRMIVCSFDLGGTSIYLFPLREAAVNPAAAAKNAVLPKKETPQEKKPAAPYCPAPIKMMQSFFRGVGERISGKQAAETPAPSQDKKPVETAAAEKPATPDYPLVKPEQVIEGVHYQFKPELRKEVQDSQKELEKTASDRPWSMGAPAAPLTHAVSAASTAEGFPRQEAKVVLVNPQYGFVVVDAGFESGFGKNVILDVVRNGRRIGKVMITKPRDKISGAVILPEWKTRDEIRSGDIVGMSK